VVDIIELSVDTDLMLETINLTKIIHYLRNWESKTPFWIQTSLFIDYYKNIDENHRYFDRKSLKQEERNLLFKDGDEEYCCLRCRKPSEIVGFCSRCYLDAYGLRNKPITKMKLDDVHISEKFITIIKSDPEYTQQIKDSILKEGMKNPLVVDKDNRVLIGHHRFYIAQDLGWEEVNVIKNNIDFNHGLFYEGKGYGLYVARIDGNLFLNTTNIDDLVALLREFDFKNIGTTLNIECYINAGADIRLRNIFIPERGDVVDQTWYDWYVKKFNKKPKIGKFS
jgi:hypothetical protein